MRTQTGVIIERGQDLSAPVSGDTPVPKITSEAVQDPTVQEQTPSAAQGPSSDEVKGPSDEENGPSDEAQGPSLGGLAEVVVRL